MTCSTVRPSLGGLSTQLCLLLGRIQGIEGVSVVAGKTTGLPCLEIWTRPCQQKRGATPKGLHAKQRRQVCIRFLRQGWPALSLHRDQQSSRSLQTGLWSHHLVEWGICLI